MGKSAEVDKSEDRIPKSEGSPKPEAENPNRAAGG
jgi:hypothetical protein